MTEALEKVFCIPEILENILLHLPLQSLLINAQLVSRSWNTLIKESLKVQHALFFKPVPAVLNLDQEPEFEFNPLLQEVFKPWFDPNHVKNQYHEKKEFHSLPWNRTPSNRSAYKRKEASWRNMLPVKPVITKLEVYESIYRTLGPLPRKRMKEFEDGVRMGALYDYVQDCVGKPVTSFWVEWELERGGGTVVIHTRRIVQCDVDVHVPADHNVEEDLRSEGYENLEIEVVCIQGRP